MGTAHLLCGLPCSGKTTYAITALRSPNAWFAMLDPKLISIYGAYSIDEVGYDEHVVRVLACRKMLWDTAVEFFRDPRRKHVNVVFDDGFFLREHRRQYIRACAELGTATTIHYLDTPLDVIREWIEKRNANLPPYTFPITPEILDRFVPMFEAPSPDEGAEIVRVAGPFSVRS